MPGKRVPAAPHQSGDADRAQGRAYDRRGERQRDDQHEAKHDGEADLDPFGDVRPHQLAAGQNGLDRLRVNLYAGHGRVDRRRALVLHGGRDGAHEHDAPAQLLGADLALQYLPGGQETPAVMRGKIYPHFAIAVRCNFEIAILDGADAGLEGQPGVLVGVGGAHNEGGSALRDAQCLHGETRINLRSGAQEQRHPAHHLVAVGDVVQHAEALGGRCEARQGQ